MNLFFQGKVRDIYEGPPGTLVMVATDRISAFDVVMGQTVPEKGKVLTGLTLHWISRVDGICPTHFITADPARYDDGTVADLAGRSMLVWRAEMIPIECVARGYLFGTAVDEYEAKGSIAGVKLPPGLRVSERLPEPIFSPAVKNSFGHDENIDLGRAAAIVGGPLAEELRDLTLRIYSEGARLAEKQRIILADTKFEFGIVGGEVTLCDEVLTPDSSRYWDMDTYKPGKSPPSFDKQYLRDFLASTSWDRRPPPPRLPPDVIEGTRGRYTEAYERVTGESFTAYLARMA